VVQQSRKIAGDQKGEERRIKTRDREREDGKQVRKIEELEGA